MEKSQILDAIRRSATANGGVAPGWRKLEADEGIAYYDWYGKYWSKWNDALREAGLAANSMTVAYEQDELLRRLAELTRKLGHFPAQGDYLLAARADSTLPSEKTLRRLGTKAMRLRLLADFCGANTGFSDVISLLPEIKGAPAEPAKQAGQETVADGFVYLIRFGRHYKIGRTNEIGRREREVALELPEKTVLVHSIRTDDPSGIEAYWHRRFSLKRRNGEWFELSAPDIRAFKKRKFM